MRPGFDSYISGKKIIEIFIFLWNINSFFSRNNIGILSGFIKNLDENIFHFLMIIGKGRRFIRFDKIFRISLIRRFRAVQNY